MPGKKRMNKWKRVANKSMSRKENMAPSQSHESSGPAGPSGTPGSSNPPKRKNRRSRGKQKAQDPDKVFPPGTEGSNNPASSSAVYGPLESKARLDSQGFDSRVTSLSPSQYVAIWFKMADRTMAKPSRSDFVSASSSSQITIPGKAQHRRVTQATVCLRDEFCLEKFKYHALNSVERSSSSLALFSALKTTPLGTLVAEQLFADGMRTGRDFGLSSYETWIAIAQNCNVWDYPAGGFKFEGKSGVYLMTSLECNMRHFIFDELSDPLHEDPENVVKAWAANARNKELDLFKRIHDGHVDYMEHGRIINPEVTKAVQHVPDAVRAIKLLSRTTDVYIQRKIPRISNHSEPYQIRFTHAGESLLSMLRTLYNHRNAVTVLHFEETPFLDRRILAIALKGLPHVTMIGVYNCPMMHYGDVLVMLDLIYEVNQERRALRLPYITAIDFAPNYEAGMPYAKERFEATYGLLWGYEDRDVVQRGFYMILMKAFLKAKAMGIKLLFDEGKAFRNFLFRVPNIPLGAPCFLDALYRYSNVATRANENPRKRAIYDLLKPVRLGNVSIDRDVAEKRCDEEIRKPHLDCASCGYRTFEDFFSQAPSAIRGANRVCAGCILQQLLDTESDHMKMRKREHLAALFPEWKPFAYNKDAPLVNWSRALVSPSRTEHARPAPHTAGHRAGLARDAKILEISVQNLPKLQDMTMSSEENEARWSEFNDRCMGLDILHATVNILVDAAESGKIPRHSARFEQFVGLVKYGKWCHVDEKQPPKHQGSHNAMCHDFASAKEAQIALQQMGFQAGPPGFRVPSRRDRPKRAPIPNYSYW